MTTSNAWPALHYPDLKDTLTPLHLWMQMVGKIRLRQMPWINHSWHVSLYVSPRGLTTGSIPYEQGVFSLEFDFLQHQLVLTTSTGQHTALPLSGGTIAELYQQLLTLLQQADITVDIHPRPNEMDPAVPFDQDHKARS